MKRLVPRPIEDIADGRTMKIAVTDRLHGTCISFVAVKQ